MHAASRHFVDMGELHAAAGRRIVDLIGVEAAHVCAVATAGIAVMAAAVMAGASPSAPAVVPGTGRRPRHFFRQQGHVWPAGEWHHPELPCRAHRSLCRQRRSENVRRPRHEGGEGKNLRGRACHRTLHAEGLCRRSSALGGTGGANTAKPRRFSRRAGLAAVSAWSKSADPACGCQLEASGSRRPELSGCGGMLKVGESAHRLLTDSRTCLRLRQRDRSGVVLSRPHIEGRGRRDHRPQSEDGSGGLAR